jgi:tetratricopeptide (TPR) repeat protein
MLSSSLLLVRTLLVGCTISLFFADAVFAQLTVTNLLEDIVDDPSDAKYKDVSNAVNAFRSNDLEKTQELLKKAVEKNADLPPAKTLLASMFFKANNLNAGRVSLEQATIDAPADPEAYLIVGDIAFQAGRMTESRLAFEKGLELTEAYDANAKRKESLTQRSYAGLAAVAEARQEHEKAKELLEKWLELDPDSTVALTRYARTLFLADDEKGAYANFQKLYKADPKQARPEIMMAQLYEQQVSQGDEKKRKLAKQLMGYAAERDADTLSTRLTVANWALGACELEMATENAQAALGIDSDSLEAKFMLGLIARYNEDWKNAENYFRTVHAASPNYFAATNNLAIVLVAQADDAKKNQALEYAKLNQRAFSQAQQPNGREAAATLAWVMFQRGQIPEAQQAMQAAINAGSVSADSAYFAAEILVSAEQNRTAQQILETTIANNECFPTREKARSLLAKITGGTDAPKPQDSEPETPESDQPE